MTLNLFDIIVETGIYLLTSPAATHADLNRGSVLRTLGSLSREGIPAAILNFVRGAKIRESLEYGNAAVSFCKTPQY